MAMKKCGRCGKSLPKGDRFAEAAHALSCPKAFFGGGAYVNGKSRLVLKPKDKGK